MVFLPSVEDRPAYCVPILSMVFTKKLDDFMKQFVINGRNMLDVFMERIGEVKEWVYRKVAGLNR